LQGLKGYRKKIAFGIPMGIIFFLAGIFMLLQDDIDTFFIPLVFVFAFGGGMIFWIVQLTREKKERQEENFRRKHK